MGTGSAELRLDASVSQGAWATWVAVNDEFVSVTTGMLQFQSVSNRLLTSLEVPVSFNANELHGSGRRQHKYGQCVKFVNYPLIL